MPKKSKAIRQLERLHGGPLTFAQVLSSERLCRELSQTAMARLLGISRSQLCDLEKGRRPVSAKRAYRFAQVLGGVPAVFVRIALQEQLDRNDIPYEVELTA